MAWLLGEGPPVEGRVLEEWGEQAQMNWRRPIARRIPWCPPAVVPSPEALWTQNSGKEAQATSLVLLLMRCAFVAGVKERVVMALVVVMNVALACVHESPRLGEFSGASHIGVASDDKIWVLEVYLLAASLPPLQAHPFGIPLSGSECRSHLLRRISDDGREDALGNEKVEEVPRDSALARDLSLVQPVANLYPESLRPRDLGDLGSPGSIRRRNLDIFVLQVLLPRPHTRTLELLRSILHAISAIFPPSSLFPLGARVPEDGWMICAPHDGGGAALQ